MLLLGNHRHTRYGFLYLVKSVGTRCNADMIQDQGRELHGMKVIAVLMIGFIFATTVSLANSLIWLPISASDFQGHAQDFRDRSADALMGRKTVPLLLSQPLARWSLAALIMAWTAGLIALWQPPAVASIAFTALGLRFICGYLSSYDEKDDYVSYCWYCVSEIPSYSLCYSSGPPLLLTIGSIVLASWKQLAAHLSSVARRDDRMMLEYWDRRTITRTMLHD